MSEPYARYRFFYVVQEPLLAGRKTHNYRVYNITSGGELGLIAWYGPWRQYCFFPQDGTVWSGGCLHDIQACLTRLSGVPR